MKHLPLLLLLSSTALAQIGPEKLQNATPKEAMKLANLWRTSTTGVKSFVTPENIEFTFPDGQTTKVPLPVDQMVIAIAPYINKTHPCKTHFMSSCTGEMQNQSVDVLVKTASGTTVMNRTVKTLPNGFLELWLPRNRTYTVTLKAAGKSASGTIATQKTSDTCITTFQLK